MGGAPSGLGIDLDVRRDAIGHIRPGHEGRAFARRGRSQNGAVGIVELNHAADQQIVVPAIVRADIGGQRVRLHGAMSTTRAALRPDVEIGLARHGLGQSQVFANSGLQQLQRFLVGDRQGGAPLREAGLEIGVVAVGGRGEERHDVARGSPTAVVKSIGAVCERVGRQRAVDAGARQAFGKR